MGSHHNPSHARNRQSAASAVMVSATVLESGLVPETAAAKELAVVMESVPESAAAVQASAAVLELLELVVALASATELAAPQDTPCKILCTQSYPPNLGTTDCNCHLRLRKRGNAVQRKGTALDWVLSALLHSGSRPR